MIKTVYLCGPINGCSDRECKAWRGYAKLRVGHRYAVLDPMDRDYRGKEDENADLIVARDYIDIQFSDILLAMANRPSWGTAMEIMLAYTMGKQILSVCESDRPSPWLKVHSSRMFRTLDEAIVFLMED